MPLLCTMPLVQLLLCIDTFWPLSPVLYCSGHFSAQFVLASRADPRVFRWFGHVERMDDYRMARRVLMAEISEGWVRGRLRLGWMDGVKMALGNRGMTVEAARQYAKDRKEWRALVHM